MGRKVDYASAVFENPASRDAPVLGILLLAGRADIIADARHHLLTCEPFLLLIELDAGRARRRFGTS